MARRRYISTEISVDGRINRIAEEYGGDLVLFYLLCISHADDRGVLVGDPMEIKARVLPMRDSVSAETVALWIGILNNEQFLIWRQEEKAIYVPAEKFYKYQSYIPKIKDNKPYRREVDPEWELLELPTIKQIGKRRQPSAKSPTNPAFLSFHTPTPTPSPSPSCVGKSRRHSKIEYKYSDDFIEAYESYPKRGGKSDCFEIWNVRITEGDDPSYIKRGIENYLKVNWHAKPPEKRDATYLKMFQTLIGPKRHYAEYADLSDTKVDEYCRNNNGTGTSMPTANSKMEEERVELGLLKGNVIEWEAWSKAGKPDVWKGVKIR